MSLKEIMARAEAAGANKKEEVQKQSVEKEVSTHETSTEELAAKQALLTKIAEQKQIDESKLAEIRKFLGTSSGFAKGKTQIRKTLSEAGMTEDEISPFIDEARTEQRSIVDEKLVQRSEKKNIQSNLQELSAEQQQLEQEISNTQVPELSDAAQAEVAKREQEKNIADLAVMAIRLKEKQNLVASIPQLQEQAVKMTKMGESILTRGAFQESINYLAKHPDMAKLAKQEFLSQPNFRDNNFDLKTGEDLLNVKVFPPDVFLPANNEGRRLEDSEAVSLGDYLDKITTENQNMESEEELNSKIDSTIQKIAPDKTDKFKNEVYLTRAYDDKDKVQNRFSKIIE